MTGSDIRGAGGGEGADRASIALAEITDAALAYLSLEDLLGELLGRVRTIIGADTAAILLLDRDRGVLVARAARGIEEEVRQGVSIPVGLGFAGRIAAERRPVAIEDVDHADILNPILRQKGIRSLLGVPLIVEGRLIGVLHVGTLERHVFTESDTGLLQMVADRAALAIDNAQLSEQRALTEVLQRRLLPETLPRIPGLTFSAKYLPAGGGAGVGGDWYDAFTLPDGRVALVIGDVVGRGMTAASVMAELRTALRAYTLERHELVHVVELLNALMLSMGRKRGATLALVALDLQTSELAVVNAGHLPPLLLGPEQACEFVGRASGPPLGSRSSSGYSEQSLSFPTGSALLLYTDGLIERRGESLDAGFERLAGAVSAGGGPAGLLADRAFNSLVTDQELEDDVALLAVESFPLGSTFAVTLDTDPGVLAHLRRSVERWLTENGVSEDQRFDVTLACSEAAANAIEHAYGPRNASFTVDGRLSPDDVVVTVSDGGSWRAESGRERGRGLTLMHTLVDDVIVDTTTAGTTITLSARRR
jgi:GAF domain-containing protein/anti-sigma regulatory factor (Ser/Thr protein kinase)